MQRSTKVSRWIGSMAAVALLAAGAMAARAEDPAPATAGHAKVTVKVVDSDGKAVAGAKVMIAAGGGRRGRNKGGEGATSQPAGGEAKAAQMTGTTDDTGTAIIPDVADGSYGVRATTKGNRGRAKVTVADGKDETVSVTLAPATPK